MKNVSLSHVKSINFKNLYLVDLTTPMDTDGLLLLLLWYTNTTVLLHKSSTLCCTSL